MNFTVFTIDGKQQTFDDNAEGFIRRWQEAYDEPSMEWPVAFIDPTVLSPTGKKIVFAPHTVVAVAVDLPANGVQPEDPNEEATWPS